MRPGWPQPPTPLTDGMIHRIIEEQDAYDRDPERYERQQRADKERREFEKQQEREQQWQEERRLQELQYHDDQR